MKKVLPLITCKKTLGINSTTFLKLFIFFLLLSNFSSAQSPADPSSIIGKVVCGYQGWFSCTGDGSPINRWTHWSPTTAPQPGVAPNPNPNLTFDAYPDISIYNPASLFQTNFANQGDGTSAKLFSSYKQDVTDKHFALMQTHGIDGVAFQRFIWEVLVDPSFKANRDTIAVHVKKAAENYSRMFYLVYDLAGLGNVPAADDQARFDAIKADWTNTMLGDLAFTSSVMYAKQDGKPVVQLWGIGYNHIIGTAAIQLDLINWFKAQGCYVIIGVPRDWRTGGGASNPGWINTYKAGDMISPWNVGAYTDQASTDLHKTNYLTPDLAYCNTNGIAYQPVIFPGFSWYNWNSGTQNQISRNKGNFLWRQAYNLRTLGITSAEIAMFDEYDEATAILSMADGSHMIPTNQYFLTTSADGTYLSSDFYLRLATKVSRQIKGTDALNATMPVPFSVGPMYFRTSHETNYDPTPTWTSTTDLNSNVTSYGSNFGSPSCATILETPHSGQYALKVMGRDRNSTTSYSYFRVFDVDIPVTVTTDLSFWTYPLNALGRFISIDLVMTDATTLRASGATDVNSVSMHPSTGRGTVGAWTKTKCNIGAWLNGKTIDKILVAYDNGPSTGDFSGYVDDIAINEQSFTILPLKLLIFTASPEKNNVSIKWQTAMESGLKHFELERSVDGTNFEKFATIQPQPGAGTKNYVQSDVNAFNRFASNSQLYYRLKIIDVDGKYNYSNIEVIGIGIPRKDLFSVEIVNPFTSQVNMTIHAPVSGRMNMLINDVSGKVLVNSDILVQKGMSNKTLELPMAIAKGIYIMKLSLGNEVLTYKLANK